MSEPTVRERIEQTVAPCPVTGCWFWLGAINSRGYGTIRMAGRSVPAHRTAYEAIKGPIPVGLSLDHLCRQRSCVNPDHLDPVTHKVNVLRGVSFAARNAAKTHCPRGHEYVQQATERVCYVCRNERVRALPTSRRALVKVGDGSATQRRPHTRTHCGRGHELTLTPSGGQRCRTCNYESAKRCRLADTVAYCAKQREYRQRKMAARKAGVPLTPRPQPRAEQEGA